MLDPLNWVKIEGSLNEEWKAFDPVSHKTWRIGFTFKTTSIYYRDPDNEFWNLIYKWDSKDMKDRATQVAELCRQ